MTKLTAQDWIEIKTRYQLGEKVRDIARDFKYSAGNISTKASKEGWKHEEIKRLVQESANGIKTFVENSTKLKQITTEDQALLIQQEIFELAQLKTSHKALQLSAMALAEKVIQTTHNFIDKHPGGVYVKSKNEKGTTVGLVTEVIKNLEPIYASISDTCNPRQTTINNNQQNNLNNGEDGENEEYVRVYVPEKDE